MNSKNTLKNKLIEKVKTSDNFAILISDPDHDSVGSGLAAKFILDKLNKHSTLLTNFTLKEEYNHLPNIDMYKKVDISSFDLSKYDVIVFLDSSNPSRVLDTSKQNDDLILPKESYIINIDHHKQTNPFGDINYIDTNTSSTGELIYELFKDEVEVDKNIATCILATIIGDTYRFRNSSSAKTFSVVSRLLEKRVDYETIAANSSGMFSKKIVKLNIDAINKIKFKKIGKIEFVYTIVDARKFGFNEITRTHRKLVQYNVLSVIKNIDFSLVFVPFETFTKLSFRSNTINIRKYAKLFGGGGHDRSAGATVKLSIEKCLDKLSKILKNEQNKK